MLRFGPVFISDRLRSAERYREPMLLAILLLTGRKLAGLYTGIRRTTYKLRVRRNAGAGIHLLRVRLVLVCAQGSFQQSIFQAVMDAQRVTATEAAASVPSRPHASSLRLFRLSTVTETLVLLPLARAWHAESRYSHLPFSEKKFLAQVTATLNRKDKGAAFFVIRGTEVVGVINLAVGEAWLSEGGCYATCLAGSSIPRSGGRCSAEGWRRCCSIRPRPGPGRGAPRSSSSMARTARAKAWRGAGRIWGRIWWLSCRSSDQG